MKVLGLAAPFGHDASAALLIDGQVVAAVEEERFTRKKHAYGQLPLNSIRFCLKEAGLKPSDIDYVAFPWSYNILREKGWEYFCEQIIGRPSQAYKKFFRHKKELRVQRNFVRQSLIETGFNPDTPVEWVEHQMAHAASAYYFSGVKEASVMSIDNGGEITCTLLGRVENGRIRKVMEVISPHSLGAFYSTVTDYLGFNRNDGEYKVMGMAPFGDAGRVDLNHLIDWVPRKNSYRCNYRYVWVSRARRYRMDKVYSKKMVEEFGPEREGDGLAEPYIHIAAATQKKLEDLSVKLVETYLKDDLEKHGNLCFAGGCALNVAMNRVLLELPYVKRLWVQPSSHDAGGALGAAAAVAYQNGDEIPEMTHAYYGPEYSNEEIERDLQQWSYPYEKKNDICRTAADLLAAGHVVAWFQGRMEWGPRALGNRSILGNPTVKGTADKINAIIKFRELWRPFCPSILKEHASLILDSDHEAPFMTIAFKTNPEWAAKMPEVVHIDGTMRPQIVDSGTNPRYHKLISLFCEKTGVPVVINTSLNRRGEPMVCSPHDALVMFEGSGLEYLAIGDFLVRKQ